MKRTRRYSVFDQVVSGLLTVFDIARDLNMRPEDFQQYIDILDKNFLTTQLALKDIDSDDWRQLGFPIGLSSQMKKKLKNVESIDEQREKEIATKINEAVQKLEEEKEIVAEDEEDINLARLQIKADDRHSTFRFDNKLELELQ